MTIPNSEQVILGVDIGGSHITAGFISLEKRSFVERTKIRRPVNSHATEEEIVEIWSDVISTAFKQSNMCGKQIGIAMPGPFDYEKGISWIKGMHKYENLYGLNIKEILAEKLNIDREDILFRNDAEAFLHGEVFGGAAYGYDKVIGITLGTGLGSAVSEKGFTQDLNLGSSRFLDGIAEDYMSSRWFLKRYFELTGTRVKNVKELAVQFHTNNIVKEIFKEFSLNLAHFLSSFIEDKKPHLVVVGGNIANAFDLFYPLLRKNLKVKDVEIQPARLGETAALIGAACLWESARTKVK